MGFPLIWIEGKPLAAILISLGATPVKTTKIMFVVLFGSLLVVANPGAASAQWQVILGEAATQFGNYLLGKTLDSIVDYATGKPDVYELRRRIEVLEVQYARMNNLDLAQIMRDLKNGINHYTTLQD